MHRVIFVEPLFLKAKAQFFLDSQSSNLKIHGVVDDYLIDEFIGLR